MEKLEVMVQEGFLVEVVLLQPSQNDSVAKAKNKQHMTSVFLSGLERRVSFVLTSCKGTSRLNLVKLSSSFLGRGHG